MRYFYDCEFIEDGRTIDLVSIGVVAEDGREYYAVSTEFDPDSDSVIVADSQRNRLQIYKKVRNYSDFQANL